LYAWFKTIASHFSHLGYWQKYALTLFSLGVVLAEQCRIAYVADSLESLGRFGKTGAIEKRLHRFLSNCRISDELCSRSWVMWLASTFHSCHWIILVDETKLGNHLGVMMVSVAYRQCAIPLLWRCYHPHRYPTEGQTALILDLLARLRLTLPSTIRLTVEADRGIGTSPDLVRGLTQLGYDYLMRVQGQTRVRTRAGKVLPIAALVTPGQLWYGRVEVFKKAGWLRHYIAVLWRHGESSPWCLVTNNRWRRGDDYALRAWQERSFRDLKSFGWQWHQSHVWQPDRAQRLLLVLAIAYTWTLAQGATFLPNPSLSPSRSAPRESLFRRSLRWMRRFLRASPDNITFSFCFSLDPPLIC
jgi:hypothetical protein